MSLRTLVVHATNLLARGFNLASNDRFDERGEPTSALFAVAQALRRALAFKTPDYAVAVIETAPLAGPDLLKRQAAQLSALLEAHGIAVVEASEAIAVVASYTHAALEAGHDVIAVGSDKRLAQLVGERVWWYDAYKDVRYTPELVRKRFEVGPEQVAGWLALTGDDDAMPGISGIGKKGATTLIETFGSVQAAISRADEVDGRTGKMLRASLSEAKSELARAELERHCPLPVALDALVYKAPSVASINDFYGSIGFLEMLAADEQADSLQCTVCTTPEATAAAMRALSETDQPVALQALTEDPTPVRGALIGLAASTGDGRAYYFPLNGDGLKVGAPLRTWLEDKTQPKVGHDVKAVDVALARRGVSLKGVIGDSACASHILDPSNMAPHDLTIVARTRLRRALPEDDKVRGVGKYRKTWAKVSTPKAAQFAGAMADTASALWSSFEPEVDRQLLDEYLALSETLVRMERHGLLCDRDDLARTGEDFTIIGAELEREIFGLAHKTFNLGSTKQLGVVLFEDLGLPIFKRTKTGWSTATDALERIEHAHPIVPLVIRWRQLQRLKDSWVTALAAAIDPDGRVRSTVHPARSFSGRLVNSNPDLGRVPGKTPEMARIRHAFIAPPGSVLLSVDYNQLGLYVLAHLTRDPALVEPLKNRDDMHTLTAAAVLERPVDAITTEERQVGKVVNFATFAGQGASALALSLGVSAQEAKQLIERFDNRYARVRAFQDEQLEKVQQHGYIETVAGRRWPLGGLTSLDPQLRSYAERLARRATHEGSVADVSRRGLLRADQALRAAGLRAVPLLQVHDEVLFEVVESELMDAARCAATAMKEAFAMEVPLRVGCEAGPNWADLQPLSLD